MKKNVVKLNERQLRKVISKSVAKALKEDANPIDSAHASAQQFIDNEEYAKQFLNWVFDGEGSRTGIMQDIWGYYDASFHHNESNAQWYFDEVLRIYADALGCEESELNVPAIKKAINYWGAYNYNDDMAETDIQESKKPVKLKESQLRKVIAESVKKVLNEWEDTNDAYWSDGPTIYDIVANIKVYSTKADDIEANAIEMEEEGAKKQERDSLFNWWFPMLYKYCKSFVNCWESMKHNGDVKG